MKFNRPIIAYFFH